MNLGEVTVGFNVSLLIISEILVLRVPALAPGPFEGTWDQHKKLWGAPAQSEHQCQARTV